MTLPNVTFTNSVGSISLQRCLLEVTDEWRWNGQAPKRSKRISVEGTLLRNPTNSESIEAILTRRGGTTATTGNYGSLVLPWTTLNRIKVSDIDVPVQAWQVGERVTIDFVDDTPYNNLYILHFFGLELHNPRLSFPIPNRRIEDMYAQIPFQQQGNAIDDSNTWYAPIRFRAGYALYEIVLTGSILISGGTLPSTLVPTCTQRTGYGSIPVSLNLPPGYPRVFKLSDAIPEVNPKVLMDQLFVARSQIVWEVEQQVAQLSISMIAQPQDYTS